MYTYLLLILLFGADIYLTIRTRFVQVRLLKNSLQVIGEKAKAEDGVKQVSSFQALMISTASRVGALFVKVRHQSYKYGVILYFE